MTDDKPMKSSLELAMERLKRQDEEAGTQQTPLSAAQKEAIAEIRSFYQAKLAEVEILQQTARRTTPDPDARQTLEDDYQRERERLSSERDAKIERARHAAS